MLVFFFGLLGISSRNVFHNFRGLIKVYLVCLHDLLLRPSTGTPLQRIMCVCVCVCMRVVYVVKKKGPEGSRNLRLSDFMAVGTWRC